MKKVYSVNSGILNALGNSKTEVYQQLIAGNKAIRICENLDYDAQPFYAAPLQDYQYDMLAQTFGPAFSLVEQMAFKVMDEAMFGNEELYTTIDFQLYISTTKGNISALGIANEHVLLQHIGKVIQHKYQLLKTPIIISNACISGASAIILAKRAIETQWIQHALIVGIDAFTPFVYKGFQSFQALSKGYCKPFDAHRNGINLGEAAAALFLSSDRNLLADDLAKVTVAGGGMTNDANHLSGPSRTGAELGTAILNALNEARILPEDVAIVSAHGTSTIYNDEMESKALHFAGVQNAKVYSLKSYIGHTLGAAGVVESAIGIMAMQNNVILASLGFDVLGTPMPLHIITKTEQLPHTHFLKTASGFGGCNAAVVFSKI